MEVYSIRLSEKQEETAMLKSGNIDFPLDVVMDLRETYPQEVLESAWNPVIAQLQRLKGYRQKVQCGTPLQLTVSDMDFLKPKD